MLREIGSSAAAENNTACIYRVIIQGDKQTYDFLREHVDEERHRFVPGNHEAYDSLPPHALTDYGIETVGGIEFFFVRGAYSIDKALRLRQERERGWKLWWEQEELTKAAMGAALTAYEESRPRIVLSHSAPTQIASSIGKRAVGGQPHAAGQGVCTTRTSELLQAMFRAHTPELWVFGHFHQSWRDTAEGTLFVCLPELGYVDLSSDGQLS